MKTIKYIFILIVLLQSCSFDNLLYNNDEEDNSNTTEKVSRYEYDNQTDTLSYLEDDTVIWKELYDFNDSGKPIFVKRLTATGTLLFSNIYSWSNDNVILNASFNINNELSYFITYKYSTDNKIIMRSKYDAGSNLNEFETLEFNEDVIVSNRSYDSNSNLKWGKSYTISDSNQLLRATSYGADKEIISYLSYDYDKTFYKTKTEAFGDISLDSTIKSYPINFSFNSNVSYGGVNTESRNTSSLTAPEFQEYPVDPKTDPIFSSRDSVWMKLEIADPYGLTSTLLEKYGSLYRPVSLKRSALEYYEGTIDLKIEYDEDKVLSKVTSYKSEELLKLNFTYNNSGLPASLETTGKVMLLPMKYSFTFKENSNAINGIEISSNDTILQSFKYTYKSDIDITNLDISEFEKSVLSIEQRDGDNLLISTYVFNYDNTTKKLTINVKDSEDVSNGKFVLGYNENDLINSFSSYSKEGKQIWDYSYSYDELKNKISENKYNKDDLPELPTEISGVDIETLLIDIKNFIPVL